MRHTLRPYATAGIVIVGAGLIAVTPIAAPLTDIQVRDVTLADSTSLPDLAAPWIDQFNTASQNATTLAGNFFLAPGVGFQQALVNQSNLWNEFFHDPTSSTLATVMQQMQQNLDTVLSGIGLQGTSIGAFTEASGWSPGSIGSMVLQHTMIGNHALMFGEIPGYLPANEQSMIEPIINFLGSPESAIVMGALGPMIAPWVALSNSITDGDDWNTTLANMVGAYFNGADLNLNSLLPTINSLIGSEFPPGMTMSELDIAFGGLLSTGSVQVANYVSGGTDVPAVGGSIFNSVGLQFTGVPTLGTLNLTSEPVGPIAAWETLSQTISGLLGSGWSDSTATVGSGLDALGGGNASPPITLDVTAPGAGIDFPTLLADLFGASSGSTDTAAAGATDLSALVQDVLPWF
ncbi:outer membrane porin GjpA [Mycolicibacter sp. MYC123]|uniref:Outer membrane porin GjpA n=1 Tax=[Mycobacterium] zoologicum TaxID=2872311 RepID=A0ABU5YPL8_9MYCO|nr:outer membrane porin GjpA [Mycolicibacter sp. MYC123]MEB3051670.1 outer membrane porin GjpA [Mycolicibacter sp. MYC123]